MTRDEEPDPLVRTASLLLSAADAIARAEEVLRNHQQETPKEAPTNE